MLQARSRTTRSTRVLALYGLLAAGLHQAAHTQTASPGLDPRKPISQYAHSAWQIDQGLPQNSVLTMAQTKDGYLWIGTERGLVRFQRRALVP